MRGARTPHPIDGHPFSRVSLWETVHPVYEYDGEESELEGLPSKWVEALKKGKKRKVAEYVRVTAKSFSDNSERSIDLSVGENKKIQGEYDDLSLSLTRDENGELVLTIK